MTVSPADGASDRAALLHRFLQVRATTEALTLPLGPEDMAAQSMAEASPTKWHLAHTTWFFSTFLPGAVPTPDWPVPDWAELFNSYYQTCGRPYPRPRRSLLTRPDFPAVLAWRQEVTEAVRRCAESAGAAAWPGLAALLELGIAHEEQHQELILTDLLHLFSFNPLFPCYQPPQPAERRPAPPLRWFGHAGGLVEIGHGGPGFAFDTEGPRHTVFLRPFRLASRLVTNGEYQAFIEAGGYRQPRWWLAEGWDLAQAEGWNGPLHRDGRHSLTLAGRQPVDPAAPVCHVSYFEADAFARWAGKRLPGEAEWECLAAALPVTGNDRGSGLLRPVAASDDETAPVQMFGDVWEWTMSPFMPYPGFRPAQGALGEYNGKFTINQMVLRGGSCVSPPGHLRASYRNFFPPAARWQFCGIRLAEDAA